MSNGSIYAENKIITKHKTAKKISHQLLTFRSSEENITSQNVCLADRTKFYQYPIIISLKTGESNNLQTLVFPSSEVRPSLDQFKTKSPCCLTQRLRSVVELRGENLLQPRWHGISQLLCVGFETEAVTVNVLVLSPREDTPLT